MNPILSDVAVSVTELKRNYASIVAEAEGAVAVLNHNKPESYLIPAQQYEALMDYIEDLSDARKIMERSEEQAVEVNLHDL